MLAHKAVLGALWTISSSIGGRSLGLIGNLVLAAMLSPTDFGEAGVAIIMVQSVSMLTSLGFGQYLVATPEASDQVAFHATFYTAVVGWAALLGLCGLTSQISPFFGTLSLGGLVPWMVVSAALDRLAVVPSRLLTRDMNFKPLGVRQVVGEVVYAVSAVAFAALGWGARALVAGNILRSLIGLLILTASVSWRRWLRPYRLRWSTTRELLSFGVPISIGNMLFFVSARWDNLVIVKMFGPGVMGQYNLAYNLADVPATHVGEQIGDVLLPSFTQLTDARARERALERVGGLLGLVVFPMALGLGVVARTLRETFLGDQWDLVGPMLAILSALAVVRPIAWLISAYLYSLKRPRTLMLLEAFKAFAILSLIPLLGQAGPLWSCAGVGVAYGAYALANVWAVRYHDRLPMRILLVPMIRPLLACLPMVSLVLVVDLAITPSGWSAAWRLGLDVCAGALAYVAGVSLIARGQARDLLALVFGALRRGPQVARPGQA
jgi:lipopolysaccharide exporter